MNNMLAKRKHHHYQHIVSQAGVTGTPQSLKPIVPASLMPLTYGRESEKLLAEVGATCSGSHIKDYHLTDANRGSRNGIHQVQSSSSSMSRRDSRENSVPEITSRSQSMSMPPPSAPKYNKRSPLLATLPSDKKVLTEDQFIKEIITVLKKLIN